MDTTLLTAGFLLVHGFVHLPVWAIPAPSDGPPPLDPGRSWALTAAHVGSAPMHRIAVVLASVVAVAYALAGIGLVADAEVTALVIVAAVLGLVLKAVWFNPWLSGAIAIDLVVLVAAIAA